MSWGTDVILLLNLAEVWRDDSQDDESDGDLPDLLESEALNAVNRWLQEGDYGKLIDLSEMAFRAGNRAMLSLVFCGAFNRLDDEEFLQVVITQPWRSPQNVQLLMKPEAEKKYSLYTIPS